MQALTTITNIALVVVNPFITLLFMITRLVIYMCEELLEVFHGNAMTPVQAQNIDGRSEMVPGNGMFGGYYGHSNAMTPVQAQNIDSRSEMVPGNEMFGEYNGHSNAMAPVQAQNIDGRSEMVLPGNGMFGRYYGHSNAMTPVQAQDTDGRSEMVLPGDGMFGGNENVQQETDKNCSKELVIGT